MFATNFGRIDWMIVILYLIITGTAGVLANRFIHSVGDYMVAGRASGAALNIATFIGTGLGLVTIMYASIDAFNRGFTYMTLAIIGVVCTLVVGGTGFVVERLRELELTTVPEYFERRFCRRTRVIGGSLCAVAGVLNMGLFPKMGATFITYATGLAGSAADARLLVNIVTSALIALVLIYTVMGGMVSVIVTDYLQFVVLSIGMALGLYFALSEPGLGWDRMVDALAQHRGEKAFNPVHPESYGWIFMVWMVFLFMSATIAWAPEVSRALTAKDPKTTKRTFFFSAPGQFVRLAIPALWAIAAYCFIVQSPDLSSYFFPDGPGAASPHAAQAMPLFLGKIVPTGLLGILVAGLMAAFMSTHDSYLLCWSSVIVRDVLGPLKKHSLNDRQQIRATRVAIIIIGVFLMLWGVWYELPESVWTYMAVTGNIYLSGASVVLIGGIYWKSASRAGSMAALLGGLVSLGGLWLEPLQTVCPWLSAGILGVGNYVFCAVLFVVVSLAFPDRPGAAAADSKEEAE